MKRLILFVSAVIIISACSNSGNNTSAPAQVNEKNEVVITNDLENALSKIPSWNNEVTVFDKKEMAHSGGFVCITNDTLEFGYTYNEKFKNINDRVPKRVVYSGWVYTTIANPKFSIICGLNDNGKQYDWSTYPLEKELPEAGKWVEFTTTFYFTDKPLKPEHDVKLYAWNQSKKPIYLDDLKITFVY
jgi:ABC-type Fe3+-hydroxamate transport system substrate-binding protein